MSKDWDLQQDNLLLNGLADVLAQQVQTVQAPNYRAVAKKLVNSLQRQYEDQSAPVNITAPIATALNITNLQSIDKLLEYLAVNKIAVDNVRVAYTKEEAATLDKDKLNIDPMTAKVGRNSITNHWETVDYYVDRKALIKYISYLQVKAKSLKESQDDQPKGQMLEVLVGKLIDGVNADNPQSGLSRKPKSEPGKPTEISDNDKSPLDSFESKRFNSANSSGNVGTQFYLLAKDLKNQFTLNDWMLGNGPEADIVLYDEKKDAYSLKWSDPKSRCAIFKVLKERAIAKKSVARTVNAGRLADLYLQRLTELEPDECRVHSQVNAKVPGPTPGSSEEMMSAINVGVLKPFIVNSIQFERIEAFLKAYSDLTAARPNPGVTAMIQRAENDMNNVKSISVAGTGFFQLNTDPGTISQYAQGGRNTVMQLIISLKSLILSAGTAYNYFYQSYGERIKQDRTGSASFDNMVLQLQAWEENSRKLQSLELAVKNAIKSGTI